jgi:hypothetical protein
MRKWIHKSAAIVFMAILALVSTAGSAGAAGVSPTATWAASAGAQPSAALNSIAMTAAENYASSGSPATLPTSYKDTGWTFGLNTSESTADGSLTGLEGSGWFYGAGVYTTSSGAVAVVVVFGQGDNTVVTSPPVVATPVTTPTTTTTLPSVVAKVTTPAATTKAVPVDNPVVHSAPKVTTVTTVPTTPKAPATTGATVEHNAASETAPTSGITFTGREVIFGGALLFLVIAGHLLSDAKKRKRAANK